MFTHAEMKILDSTAFFIYSGKILGKIPNEGERLAIFMALKQNALNDGMLEADVLACIWNDCLAVMCEENRILTEMLLKHL